MNYRTNYRQLKGRKHKRDGWDGQTTAAWSEFELQVNLSRMTRQTALASVICSLVDVSTINLASVKLGSKGWLCFPAAENKN